MTRRRLVLVLVLLTIVALFFLSGANELLTLANLQAEQARFQAWLAEEPVVVVGGFFVLYVLMAALSLPGATLLTVLGGALFGFGWGLLIISFASALGATLAALIARTLARAPLEKLQRYQARMGWQHPTWVSSLNGSFNQDMGVTSCNCHAPDTDRGERHGISVFLRDGERVFRTYFSGKRGVEYLGSLWTYLDLTPYGRQETWEESPPGWPQTPPYVWNRRHDEYET